MTFPFNYTILSRMIVSIVNIVIRMINGRKGWLINILWYSPNYIEIYRYNYLRYYANIYWAKFLGH